MNRFETKAELKRFLKKIAGKRGARMPVHAQRKLAFLMEQHSKAVAAEQEEECQLSETEDGAQPMYIGDF
jgi:hypothetical protein